MHWLTRARNFWLPLAGGVLMAAPVLFLGERPARAVLPPPDEPAAAVESGCGPLAESFAVMLAEAETIAHLAELAAISGDEAAPLSATVETWREIAATARRLDDGLLEASSATAPLSLREAAVVALSTSQAAEMRADSAFVSGELIAPASERDAALLVGRMQAVGRTAAAVGRSLEPLAICQPFSELGYAPATGNCETLDPEYQYAMLGPCFYSY